MVCCASARADASPCQARAPPSFPGRVLGIAKTADGNTILLIEPKKTTGMRMPDTELLSAVRPADLDLRAVVAKHIMIFPGASSLTAEGLRVVSLITVYGGDSFERLAARFPAHVSAVRGVGTLVAFDVPGGPAARDALVGKLRTAGVDIPSCGESTIRARPGLFFTQRHSEQFLGILEGVLAKL